MKSIRLKLEELEPMYGYEYHSPTLVEKIKNQGWEGIPPVPVIEIPEDLRSNEKKYSHTDGHHRHNAAIKTGEEYIEGILYGKDDDPEEISQITGNGYLIDYDSYIRCIKTKRES